MKAKRKLELKKEVVTSLTNLNNIRGGNITNPPTAAKKTDDADCFTAIQSFCICESIGCNTREDCPVPQPPVSGGCGPTGHCTYACATYGYGCVSNINGCAVSEQCAPQ